MVENRRLTADEERLLRWMLVQGGAAARALLPQVDSASVTPARCPCGCASFELQIDGHPQPTGGMTAVAEFYFGEGDYLSGIFAYEQDGLLGGVEVYGLAGDAPRSLPKLEELHPMEPPAPEQDAAGDVRLGIVPE